MAIMHGQMTGKEIAASYTAETSRQISPGSFYTTLRRLETTGLVRKRRSRQSADKRYRRFSRTAMGVAAVARKRREYIRLVQIYDDVAVEVRSQRNIHKEVRSE